MQQIPSMRISASSRKALITWKTWSTSFGSNLSPSPLLCTFVIAKDVTYAFAGRVYESEHQPSHAIQQFRKLLKRDREYTHEDDYSIPIVLALPSGARAVVGAGFTGRDNRRMDRTRQHPESKRSELGGWRARQRRVTFNQPIRNGNTTETQRLHQRKPSPFSPRSVIRIPTCKSTRSD